MTESIRTTEAPGTIALLFLKSFTSSTGDRYFLHDGESMREVSAREVSATLSRIITHDYGTIAPSIREQGGKLPPCVIDINEFHRATCATTQEDGRIENISLEELLRMPPIDFDATRYNEVFYRKCDYDETAYFDAGKAILTLWPDLCTKATENDEIDRYTNVEAPVFNLVWAALSEGIRIDQERLRQHKESARDDFYLTLRDFAIDFSLPIEVPSRFAIDRELEVRGFDVSEGNQDYIVEFLPMQDHFGDRLSELLKTSRTLNALNQLASSRRLAHPLAEIAGTRTSRILLKAPALQHLAKRHRDIVRARDGKELLYVDYCQFEPGIMAALSGDPHILRLYRTGDLYKEVSQEIFGSREFRKVAKRLFLSYSYGMSLKKIADAARESGADRKTASDFFRQFKVFEDWKSDVIDQYGKTGRIGTALGNYARRSAQGVLTAKEKRSCISQVVQGTGSLIFKKALLALHEELGVAPLIPMHDAILFESSDIKVGSRAVAVMERIFTENFEGRVTGRAELTQFAEIEQPLI